MKFSMLLTTIGILFQVTKIQAASDLTREFKFIYQQKKEFTVKEISRLQNFDIILIPGILAESLIEDDNRSILNLALITRDYFYAQVDLLQNKYKLPVHRLTTSSKNISETQHNIRHAVNRARENGRKVIFISHSLGGLALLEEVIKNPILQRDIAGVAFLQSPFYGSPLGNLITNPPNKVLNMIKPLLPFLNISQETIRYVGVKSRTDFMQKNRDLILDFVHSIPVFTFTGTADANRSIFKPLIDIMETGCIKGIKLGCLTETLFDGPYDKSDGLIPFRSSFIEDTDYVIMDNVDHGEFILNVPFQDYEKEHLTTTWIRILLDKIK